jgi:hypothetical protein
MADPLRDASKNQQQPSSSVRDKVSKLLADMPLNQQRLKDKAAGTPADIATLSRP